MPATRRLLALPLLLALLHQRGVAGAEADDGAFGHEGIDDGAADALGAAGDQNALALETEVHVSSEAALAYKAGMKQGSRGDVQAIRP